MSYIQVRDDLDLYEYWQLLAVAYDAQELQDYNMASLMAIAVNNPKQLRKWKFATADKAGTRPSGVDATQSLMGIALSMFGPQAGPMGDGMDYAKATGKRIIYIAHQESFKNDKGETVIHTVYVDDKGVLVERQRGDFVIQKPPEVIH